MTELSGNPDEPVTTRIVVRWDDVDPNLHLRHTCYGTYAAQARLALFKSVGVNITLGQELRVSPILFTENLAYRREVGFDDEVTITAAVSALRRDGSRFSIHHEVLRPDGQLAATVDVTGAWIDLASRKLAAPDQQVADLLWSLPRTDDFTELST